MAIQTKVICSAIALLGAFIFQSAHAGYDAKSCRTPYADHGVYDATIVYMIDEVVEGPLLLPMDSDRNIYKYRQAAYRFFRDQFGLQFDASNSGVQVINDIQGGRANVFPVKTGTGSTHQVYAVDAQRFPAWRSKMPLTNVAFFDDGFS